MSDGEASIVIETASVEQTLAVGRAVAGLCRAGDLVALDGELGAGKTQFVRGLAAGLGADDQLVSSPTFVLMHEYPIDPAVSLGRGDPPEVLVHIDGYRLRSLADLESLGWEPAGDGPIEQELRRDAVVAIEWARRLGDTLGADRLDVTIEHIGEDRRRLTFTPRGGWAARRAALQSALAAVRPT